MSRYLVRGLICLSIFALLAAGCGEPTDDSSNAGGSSQQTNSLKLEVRARAGADAQSATLRCGPSPEATGFITDAAAACEVVDASKHVLIHGPPDNIACTEIYGGPQQARITGTIDGQRVDLKVTRENGCEIALWDELEQILNVPSET